MLGIKDKAGVIEIKGKGIRLTLESSQEELKSAIKHHPYLKKGGFIIELSEKQQKERAAKIAAKSNLNENKNDN